MPRPSCCSFRRRCIKLCETLIGPLDRLRLRDAKENPCCRLTCYKLVEPDYSSPNMVVRVATGRIRHACLIPSAVAVYLRTHWFPPSYPHWLAHTRRLLLDYVSLYLAENIRQFAGILPTTHTALERGTSASKGFRRIPYISLFVSEKTCACCCSVAADVWSSLSPEPASVFDM